MHATTPPTAANDNHITADHFGDDLAARRAWLEAMPPLPAKRRPLNLAGSPDLARPCVLWWRDTLQRVGDGSTWPDGSADNDNPAERPSAVRDINPRPRHTAEALLAAARACGRVSVTILRRTDGSHGPIRRRRHYPAPIFSNGHIARLGGLEFTTEGGNVVQFVRDGAKLAARRFRVSPGTMIRMNGYPLKGDTGRSRPSRAASEVAADRASAVWYQATLGGGVLPHSPAPRALFMWMAKGRRSADPAVRTQVDHVETIEDVLIAREDMARFRAAHPLEADVLDRAMTASRFADLAANDNAATGRRLLRRAVDALEGFLAA